MGCCIKQKRQKTVLTNTIYKKNLYIFLKINFSNIWSLSLIIDIFSSIFSQILIHV